MPIFIKIVMLIRTLVAVYLMVTFAVDAFEGMRIRLTIKKGKP